MSRRFGRGHVLGPIVAFGDEDAIAVARPHIEAHAGRFLRADTHLHTGIVANFVQQCGLSIYDTVMMTSGEGADYGLRGEDRPAIFALALQSMG